MDVLNQLDKTYEKELCKKADIYKIPLGGTFELSPLCNMQCKMCYIEQNNQKVINYGGLKDVNFWIDIAKQAVDSGMFYLLLTGGEPLLYPNFKELYLKLKELGIHIVINTNGTLLSEDVIQMFEKYPPRRLNISMYGTSYETYDRLCQHGENYNKVINNLNRLKETSILVRLHSVLTPYNINDYEDIVKLANYYQMPLGVAYYMYPSIRKGNSNLNLNGRFTPKEAAQAKFRYTRDSTSEKEFRNLVSSVSDNLTNYKEYSYYGCDTLTCRAGRSSFWVNWQGKITPCGMMNEPVVNLENHDFSYAWEKIKDEALKLRMVQDCAFCQKRQFCNVCLASIYAENGDYNHKPIYICELTDEYIRLLLEEKEKSDYNT